MYVGNRKRGMGRVAGAHRFSGLRGLRGRRLGQDDWGSIIDNAITTAGKVASVAVSPGPVPTYSYQSTPYGTSIQSFAPGGASAIPSSILPTSTVGTDLTSLLSSPLVLIGGIALIALVAMKR